VGRHYPQRLITSATAHARTLVVRVPEEHVLLLAVAVRAHIGTCRLQGRQHNLTVMDKGIDTPQRVDLELQRDRVLVNACEHRVVNLARRSSPGSGALSIIGEHARNVSVDALIREHAHCARGTARERIRECCRIIHSCDHDQADSRDSVGYGSNTGLSAR
jgi:hypothetical protein